MAEAKTATSWVHKNFKYEPDHEITHSSKPVKNKPGVEWPVGDIKNFEFFWNFHHAHNHFKVGDYVYMKRKEPFRHGQAYGVLGGDVIQILTIFKDERSKMFIDGKF